MIIRILILSWIMMKTVQTYFKNHWCSQSRIVKYVWQVFIIMHARVKNLVPSSNNCTRKNEVFHCRFLQQMWLNRQKTADMVIFTEKLYSNGKLKRHSQWDNLLLEVFRQLLDLINHQLNKEYLLRRLWKIGEHESLRVLRMIPKVGIFIGDFE